MIELPFPPSANRYWRTTVRGSRPVTYKSNDARVYLKDVAARCMVDRVRPLDGPVAVDIVAHFPTKAGDLDNILKVLLDSLEGFFYQDDKQVHHITAVRQLDREHPRVEVSVFPLEEVA